MKLTDFVCQKVLDCYAKGEFVLHIRVSLWFDMRIGTKCTDFGGFFNADKLQQQHRLICKNMTQMISTIFKRVYAKWEFLFRIFHVFCIKISCLNFPTWNYVLTYMRLFSQKKMFCIFISFCHLFHIECQMRSLKSSKKREAL